jgi:hypothetical protein
MSRCIVNHQTTGHLVFVLISTEQVMICSAIDNPASFEICTVNCFLRSKNMSGAEIHRELCTVYCQNVMSEGTVTHWCRLFKDGRTDIHDEEQSGQPSVASDDLVQSVDQKICER